MQQIKNTQKISEIEALAANGEKIADTISRVVKLFGLNNSFRLLDCLKSKGLAMSSLLSILVILPFAGVASVWALVQHGAGRVDFEGKKDAFYEAKNNHFIDWRKLLLLHAKRFKHLVKNNVNLKSMGKTALVFDDSILEKTGKKIEKVSRVHNHASGASYVFGYKLLVCGFWDGTSFIPLDFSLHREKGNKHSGLISAYNKTQKRMRKLRKTKGKNKETLENKDQALKKVKADPEINNTKTGRDKLTKAKQQFEKRKRIHKDSVTEYEQAQVEFDKAKAALKKFYDKGQLYGLTAKERKAQFKKAVPVGCPGFKRRKETDRSKIDIMLEMLGRAVKNGFVPDYVLTDSWFFCIKLIEKLHTLRSGSIKLISMTKVGNQLFTLCSNDKEMSAKAILNLNKRKSSVCRKLKADYIKVPCRLAGHRVNLFYVRMGKSDNWHLLVTTDLSLSFIALMENYQIRWSIEVFFRDCKQHLNIGDCRSNTFDAQIADLTLSMFQYVMIVYCKRINYQQSFDHLFKQISQQMVEVSIVKKLITFIWELVQVMCECAGIDFIEFQKDIIKNEKVMDQMLKLIPPDTVDIAA